MMAVGFFGARTAVLFNTSLFDAGDGGGDAPVDIGDAVRAGNRAAKASALAIAGAAPVLDLNGAGAGTSETLDYTEDETAKIIAPSATVDDPDSANFAGGILTLAITAGGTADDRLVVIDQG